jgi:hypothetical protein
MKDGVFRIPNADEKLHGEEKITLSCQRDLDMFVADSGTFRYVEQLFIGQCYLAYSLITNHYFFRNHDDCNWLKSLTFPSVLFV